MKRIAAFLAALSLALAACGTDYDHIDINVVGSSFSTADNVSLRHIQVTEGQIVTAHIVVFNDDDEHMPLTFKLDRNDIIDLVAVVNPDNYAFIGKQIGHTEVQFVAAGERIVTINVDVVAQPSP